MKKLKLWITCLVMVIAINTQAQIVLQLEKFNQVKTYKYLSGSSILIKQKDFPDVWTRKTISEILVNQNTIVFDDLIVPLDDIIAVQHQRPIIAGLSKKLYQFGITWFAFAGILHVTDRFDIGRDTFLVGGGAFVAGYAIKAIFFKRTFTIGKNSRLRILDLNMYDSNFD